MTTEEIQKRWPCGGLVRPHRYQLGKTGERCSVCGMLHEDAIANEVAGTAKPQYASSADAIDDWVLYRYVTGDAENAA